MDTISINIGRKNYSSTSPNVGILKLFLQFKNDFAEKQSFDDMTIVQLSELIKKVFPSIKGRMLETISINDFVKAANLISEWLAQALKDAEKKL